MSEPMTIRVKDRKEIDRGIAKLEIEYDEFLDAYPHEIYTAMAQLALDNSDQFRAKLGEVRED